MLGDAGIIHNRHKVEATIANARTVCDLRDKHGSVAAWLDHHHPMSKEAWVTLFKSTFHFTAGEIVGEFLMSPGYLPGAHRMDCPVIDRIARLRPPWMRI